MTRVVVGGASDGGGGGGGGSFFLDTSSTLLVGPRPRSFQGSTVGGSLVVTPLRRKRRSRGGEGKGKGKEKEEEGALVVRGWVPSGWREEQEEEERGDETGPRGERERNLRSPPPAAAAAAPSLLCVLRSSESPSRFVPANDPSKNLWHWVDAGAMAEAVGLPREGTPLLEVVASPDGGGAHADGAAPSLSSAPFDGGGGGGGGGSPAAREDKKRPSLMEVLGGRTAERGPGSPGSLSASAPEASLPPPSSPLSARPKEPKRRPRPQPRSLEEISQVSVSPGQHLQYAATWGTLAVATAALAVKVGRRGR